MPVTMRTWLMTACALAALATGDEGIDTGLLVRCMRAWKLAGYRGTNYQGIIDWYREGGPPEAGPAARDGPRGRRNGGSEPRDYTGKGTAFEGIVNH